MSRVFVDANVLLEIMFARPKLEQASQVLRNPDDTFAISTLTVHILYYFAEAEGIDREFVWRLAGLARHVSLLPETIQDARERYNGKDFEDCLQALCAERAGCDKIVTLDKGFKRASGTQLPVTVL